MAMTLFGVASKYAKTVDIVFVIDAVFPNVSVMVALTDNDDDSASPVPETGREKLPEPTVAVPAVPVENVTVAVLPETLR